MCVACCFARQRRTETKTSNKMQELLFAAVPVRVLFRPTTWRALTQSIRYCGV